MSNNIKYTSDGKKVVVVGNLNSQETIVQEIFVSNGIEIPSGENFVVRSLHDAPAVSWKESELKKLEERYDREKKTISDSLDKLNRDYKLKATELRAKLSYIGSALKNADEQSFQTLVDYITGEIEWIIVDHHNIELLPISEFNQMYEGGLRLISLFGKDDGTFTYAIGSYYDFSGSHYRFIPFKTYEEALVRFKEIIVKRPVSQETINIANKYGFQLPLDKVKEFEQKKIQIAEQEIKKANSIIEKNKEIINSLSPKVG